MSRWDNRTHTKQAPGNVSIELVVALATATHALEVLTLTQRTGSLRIKPSSFDQQADPDSTAWAATAWPLDGPSSLH